MGKKVKRNTYTSKGERNAVARATVGMVRRDRDGIERAMNKLNAWREGKDPWITVPGPSKNMAFIRVRANKVWGDPRRTANIYKTRGEE